MLLQELAATQRKATPDDAPGFRAGQVVGRFELVREIGRGGFGVVYEARDRELRRAVAFKALRASGSAAVRGERLLLEADAAARLSHPNIVTLYDVGRTDEGPYLILEMLHGETLARRLRAGSLPTGDALRVCAEVAKGLAHAHARGVVHRDLTPGNIFLCEDGQVKLLDFGMAHAFGRRKVDGGTRPYMAPEQRRGAPEDERTDVFALGVVLYRMLTGKLPIVDERASGDAASPPGLHLAMQPRLASLIARMLQADPVRRPRDAREVLAALSALEREVATAPRLLSPTKRTPRLRAVARGLAGALKRRRALALLFVVCGLAAVAAVAWHRRPRHPPGGDEARAPVASTIHSIAVLPFADLSPQHDQEYFSDGVADEILNALARVEGLRVPGRTSSFYYKGKDVKLSDIGRELRVESVLEGSVRKEGQRLRVTARLVRIEDEAQLWSERYDRDLTGVFAIQDDIASAVVRALAVSVSPGVARAEPRPRNAEAYSEYLLGRHLLSRASLASVSGALDHLERAVSLDPHFAPGWGLLAGTIAELAVWSRHIKPEDQQRAMAAAEKAIALAPDEASGYLARATLENFVLWDWERAQRDLERALQLGNSYVIARNQYAVFLDTVGRPGDAIVASRKATELDPLNPANWVVLGWLYLEVGELESARSALTRQVEISGIARSYDFGMLELLGGKPDAALALFRQVHYEPGRLSGIALALHDLGRAAESDEALHELVGRYGERAYDIASVHAWRGERDRAFEWLQRAYDAHDLPLSRLKCDFLFKPLHGDPRWTALLKKMKLPVD